MARAPRLKPRPLVAGNWKMNGLAGPAAKQIKALAQRLAAADGRPSSDIVICPPATLIAPLRTLLKELGLGRRVALGGQDCHLAADGAHTGDTAAGMLADAGCRYVIVGHSERRTDHGETDALVRAKATAAHAAGLTAIICIGESRSARDRGRTLAVLSRQIAGSLPDQATARNTVVAYEPVWAIGTGLTPTLDDVARAHGHIRRRLAKRLADADRVALLYGGSVKAANAADLLAIDQVNGALVGGASLTMADFWPIIMAAP